MSGRIFPFTLAAAALIAGAPEPLLAVTPPLDASASVDLLQALTLQKLEDMEFGAVTVTAPGTAVIDPISNSMATSGGVTAVSGTPHAARFRGAASGSAVVIIRLPKNPVALTRVGGTETIMLSDFTLDGPSKRAMAGSPTFEFRVGGMLTIPANPVDGDYEGDFTVTAQYP
ncbi:MAG TPA: DUF4402 domain-containing protein [Sphingomicrobium sp.]|nr:DUF4402 domain-containing protein [Sphingomicrobium sp.]